jgi:hypothetical protein
MSSTAEGKLVAAAAAAQRGHFRRYYCLGQKKVKVTLSKVIWPRNCRLFDKLLFGTGDNCANRDANLQN